VAVRNGLVGGSFLPTTSQGGVNFYIGNNPQADGTYQPIVPGKQIPALERREPARLAEQAMGRRLTAGEVSRYWLGRSLDWVRREPGAFARLQVRKLGMFWSWYEWPDAVDYYHVKTLSPVLRLPLLEFGGAVLLALAGLFLARRRLGTFAPVLLYTLGWMLTTVVFFLFSRYRLPAVPALLVLGGVTLASAAEAWRDGNRRRTAGLAAIVVIALLLPRALGYEPRMDLVEYNLGRLYDEQGRPGEAREVLERIANEISPRILASAKGTDEWRRELDEYFAAERTGFDLPVDRRLIHGIARDVLVQTSKIAFGRTNTYGEIAKKIGHPSAARAVGRALGSNPIPIVIPCHRVIGANGKLTGYAGGLDRKIRLLELEGVLAPS
jgi:O-6-methylguanine DNA methyltransferase